MTLVETALADRTDENDDRADDGSHGSADEYTNDRAADNAPEPGLIVVTADRGLIERLPPGVATLGPGRFRDRIAEHRDRRE